MGRDKKKQAKTNVKNVTTIVVSVSADTLTATRAEIVDITTQHETLAAEFKAITNKIKWKEKAVVSERGKLLKERTNVLTLAMDVGLIEKNLSLRYGQTVVQDTIRYKVDMSADLEFQAANEKLNNVLTKLVAMQYKLGAHYMNELVLIYLKCLILKSKFFDSENQPAKAMRFMHTAYLMFVVPFSKGKLKFTHDIGFQEEMAWLFKMLNEYANNYTTDISNPEMLLNIAMEACRFAEKCENEALKLTLYCRALYMPNAEGKLMLLHPKGINVADFFHLYDVTRKKFFNLIANKKVDAKAILDFVEVSFMIFIFKNTSSRNSLYAKKCHDQIGELNPLKCGLPSDADFRAHLEMTKNQRLEYLESALRLLMQTNLSIVFSDMEIYEQMKRMLINYRSHLYTNIIVLYQKFLKQRAKSDNLSADIELEILQFERLAIILLDCFQYLEEFRLNDVKVSKSNAPYKALQQREKEIKTFKEDEFLRGEKIAQNNAEIVLLWSNKQKEFEVSREDEQKNKTTKKKPFYKVKKVSKEVATEIEEVSEPAEIEGNAEGRSSFESGFNTFMQNGALYIADYQYAHAITAYEVAKHMASKAGDTYKKLCAIDGLIYASGAEQLQHLDYMNAMFAYRLDSQKVMKPDEQKSLLTLLIRAVDKFKKIKLVYEEYEVIVNSAEIATNTDIQAGVDHGKSLIEELLSFTESKVVQAQSAYARLQSEALQENADFLFRRGLAAWRKAGNKGPYTVDQIKRLGKKILRQEWLAKKAAYCEQYGDKAFSPEEITSNYTKERELFNEMEPLMADLHAVPASIRPSVERIVTTGRYIEFLPNVWWAFERQADLGMTQLLVGESVAKLLRGLLTGNVLLPNDAIWVGSDTEGNCAKFYAAKQFYTKTTVCCNRTQRLIVTYQTAVDDILNYRLRMVAANPDEQINRTPECLIEAIKHMREGDNPEERLEKAMREWLPDENYSKQCKRVLTVIKEQFLSLPLAERINQVKILIEYGLMKKLFNIDHKESQRALWSLEDKWLPSVSISKFHLLAGSPVKLGSRDDVVLTPSIRRIV